MPKLVQINVAANWGSTGRIAEQIGLKAREAGWESSLVYGRLATPSALDTFKVGNPLSVVEHFIEDRLLDNEGRASRLATRRLVAHLKALAPDVVHLHNIHDHWLNYEMLFRHLRETGVPVVWTFHDCWAFTGHCRFTHDDCDRWRSNCAGCRHKHPFGLDCAERNFARKRTAFTSLDKLTIVPVSDWMGGLVKDSFLKDCAMQVIHNGVDLNAFNPHPDSSAPKCGLQADNNRTVVLGVSSVWQDSKGLQEFIRLSENPDYQVVMVGVPDRLRSKLPRAVMAVGRTSSQRELAAWYRTADVFVNPTYLDNYPTVNLEAMACGTPVVTYRTGGSPEAVDAATGIVVEQGDFNALCAAVETVRRNGRSRYADACRMRAEALFDKEKCYEAYLDLYRTLL